MKRPIVSIVAVAFIAGCGGMGSGSRGFVPMAPGAGGAASSAAYGSAGAGVGAGSIGDAHRPKTNVQVSVRIPRRHRGERTMAHPSSISSATLSLGIGINGGKATVFDTTPSSPGCSVGPKGTTCSFTVSAPVGSDTFAVSTFSAPSGGGAVLDHGTTVANIVRGKTNNPQITLGPVVSTTSDNGMGSLRYAIGTANAGDTIMFLLPAGSTVSLTSPLTISTNVNIGGPGVTASSRRRSEPDTTFSGMTVSGGNAHQVFIIKPGVTATISGLIVTAGQASVANQPGGAISNQGTLTLNGDAVTHSTSLVTNVRGVPARPVRPHKARVPGHVPVRRGPAHTHARVPHACVVSEQYGGALYNNGTLTITGTTFDSNTVSDNCAGSGYGGAIYNDTDGSMTVTSSTFSNNAGAYGGAIYNAGSNGQATFANDAFTGNQGCTAANGCTTSGCSLPNSCSTYAYGYGAAIYDADGPGASIATSAFTSNVTGGASPSSEGYGGAVYLGTGSPIVTGSTFTGNLAGGGAANCSYGYGGAIYEDAGSTLELDNDTFTSNKAGGDDEGYGGAVYNNAQPDHGSNDVFTGNVAFGSGSPCRPEAQAYGAAIYADDGISMSGSTFSSNTATSAYYTEGGVIYLDAPSTLSGNTFTANTATTTSLTGEDGYVDGGVIENDDSLKLTNNTFTGNAANAGGLYGYDVYGGVVYDQGGLYSSRNTFSSTTTSTTYPDDGYVYGGVLYVDHGCCSGSTLLSSSGDTFKSNAPTSTYEVYGGVIYADTNSQLNVANDTFTSNVASAIYVDAGAIGVDAKGTNTISNSTFTGNAAGTGTQQGWSGAIEADDNSAVKGLTVSGSTFSGNSATAGGGAIGDFSYTGSSPIAIDNSVFSGNFVSRALNDDGGGALLAAGHNPAVVMTSTFSGNAVTPVQVGTGGGAITNYSGLVLIASTLSGNRLLGSVPGTGGGGIFSVQNATILNSTITGNTSTEDGGGIETYANHGIGLLNDTIYQNKASGNGGNIENPYTIVLANTIVAGGTAGGVGPDVDNSGGTFTSADWNLIQTPLAGNPMATPNPDHDLTGVDPVLLPLANNGGPTLTNADTSTSPGKAHIPFSGTTCGTISGIPTDQRGYARGAGGKCDIGAYEFGGVASAIRIHVPALAGTSRRLPRAPVKPKHDPHQIHRSPSGAK